MKHTARLSGQRQIADAAPEPCLTFDPYILFLLGLGAVVLLVSWAPVGLKRMPLTLAILCVALGVAAFSTGLLAFDPDPRTWDTATERLTELVVIISLMGAGLKLDRPPGWRKWSTTWRLLAIAMPLTIAAVAFLGWAGLGFSLAMALLFGASMAPTDPVLAADVQVGPPKSGDEDEVRFGLTSEAGLNDALAFPFVHLAILAAAGGLATQAGLLIGKVLGHLLFRSRRGLSKLADGLIALAATLITYALAEMIHGYGFLAVFVCAVMIRGSERDHEFHQEMHDFSDQIERLLMMLLLVLFGGALANGLLSSLTWTDALIGIAVVFVVRPVAGLIAMAGSSHPWRERLLLAFLGIRGVGSVYYLAYGINHGDFGNSERLWAVVGFIILLSIIVHGVTATPLLARRRAVEDA